MKSGNTTQDASTASKSQPFFSKGQQQGFFGKNAEGGSFFGRGTFLPPGIQAKLTVGEPHDKHEQEADATADKVVQRLTESKGQEPALQPTTPMPAIQPASIQTRCDACEQEEKLQKKEEEGAEEEMEPVQKKPIFESGGEPPHDEEKDKVQRKAIFESNEEKIQRKCAHCEAEEKLQKKEEAGSPQQAPESVEATLQASKGSGMTLPRETREQMETSFGADFSGVRIHTGSDAVQMNKELSAQAFTHGNDIYFNAGKFDTGSQTGQHLLAHELTHTIQQGGSVMKKGGQAAPVQKKIQRSWYGDAWDATTDFVSDVGSDIAGGAKAVGGAVVSGAKAVGGFVYDVGAEAFDFIVNRLAPGLLDFLSSPVQFIKDKIAAGIDALTGGQFSQVQSKGFAAILMQLLGSAFTSVGSAIAEGCSYIPDIAKKLWAFVKTLAGPAIKALKVVLSAIGKVFSFIWDDLAMPAWDAIKKYAGKAWDWIVDKATWLWDITEPIRRTVGKAWDWIKKKFGIAWSEAGSALGWIKEKAAAAWNWVKNLIQPIIGPLKIIGGILLMLSPLGPIILIYEAAPKIWDAIKWLAEQFNKHVILKAKDVLYKQILPTLKSGLEQVKGLVNSAMSWIGDAFTQLGMAINSLFISLSTFWLFRIMGNAIRSIGNDIRAGANWVGGKAVAFGKWVSGVAARVWQILEPLMQLLRNLILMGLLGPLAIMDDGVWHMMQSIVSISMKIPCIRELEGLLEIPHWMQKLGQARQGIKDMYFMFTHPDVLEAKAKEFLEPYIKEVPGRSQDELSKGLAKLGLASAKHTAGILRYLLPAVKELVANWWPEVKKMIWYLVWPFAEGSPLYTDGPKLWKLLPGIWNSLWSGNFKMARDQFLEWMQALNNVVGIFGGWLVIGGALIGAIVGAFAGGVGAIPGAGAGFEIGLEIGEGVMISMIATETAILASAVNDLATTDDDGKTTAPAPSGKTEDNAAQPGGATQPGGVAQPGGAEPAGPTQRKASDVRTGRDRIEFAYQRIANSSITLGILGAMMLLGAIGGEIAKGLMSAAESALKFIAEKVPGLGELASDIGGGLKNSKFGQALSEGMKEFEAGRKMVKGEVPTPEKPVIDEEGRSIIDADESLDGKRTVEMTEKGECIVCASPCDKLIEKYESRIDKIDRHNGNVRERIKAIEDSNMSLAAKKRAYRQIEQILRDSIEADGFASGSTRHMKQRWIEYQLKNPEKFPTIDPDLPPTEKWMEQYDQLQNLRSGDAAVFEQKALAGTSPPMESNQLVFEKGKVSFKPDGLLGMDGKPVTEVKWGEPYHFKEVKSGISLSDTGNLSQMLDYVEKYGGEIDVVVNKKNPTSGKPTELSGPLRDRIEALEANGQARIIEFKMKKR